MAYISFQPKDNFTTKLYTGNNSSSNAITGVGFQPDWVWLKGRNVGDSHRVFDAVRGAANYITPNANVAESSAYPLTSFDSDGFTIGSSDASVNGSYNYVSWNWKANGSGSSNSDGDLTSTVSANTTTGVSIGTYTSDISSSGSKTVGHGLGETPKLIITKNLGVAGQRWGVQAPGLLSGDSYILQLNETSAEDNQSGNGSLATVNSTVFSVNWAEGLGNANSGGNYVFYAFTDIKGYSKFDSYTGSGSDLFVYTGFKPAFLICKRTNSADNWKIVDNKRSPFNVVDDTFQVDNSNAEGAPEGGIAIDFLSNGFAFKSMSNVAFNGSGDSYIYMAFAEHPIVSSNGVPATAR